MKQDFPSDKDFPAALAEVMGARLHYAPTQTIVLACGRAVLHWDPLKNRNDSYLAVQRCRELKLMSEYCANALGLVQAGFNHNRYPELVASLTAEQEAKAAYFTLKEGSK